ncbi:MAG TPA: hypothetical protein VGO11_08390 [Chthoniobacteraceae bacterium]|jgi:hypothetical protein|nr:hypothetical protein [Chthoniobacteraceae bacterium]
MALPQLTAATETSSETTAPRPELHLLPKPGRPSLFSPGRTAAICAIIQTEGISDSAAGALAGVTASTLARWKVEHEGFALELEMARALFERARVRTIREARKRDGTPDWRAAAWLLKHSSPEGYGPVSRMRKVTTAGVHADARTVGDCQSEVEQEQAQEHEGEGGVQSEKCAKLPETPRAQGARDEGNGRRGSDERACIEVPASQNCANLPESPRSVAALAPARMPGSQNHAILPETRVGATRAEQPAGPRLSRRERRAEERRLAKAKRGDA